MRKKMMIVVLILAAVFFIGTVGVLVHIDRDGKLSVENTALYTVTVRGVQITGTSQLPSVEIDTEEYTNSLYVAATVVKNIDLRLLEKIKPGQKVFFRIKTSKCGLLNNAEFIDVVALKTNEADIFNLPQYNRFFNQAAYPAKISGVVVAGLFLLLQACMLVLLKKVPKKAEQSSM